MEVIHYITDNTPQVLLLFGQHFVLFAVSMFFAILTGISLAIYVTAPGNEKKGNMVVSITSAAQAVPPLAIVALAFIFVGIGAAPSIIALILYSIVPILFNASSGLLSVPPKVIEAGRGLGLTQNQLLWKIRIPMSLPVIMAGIRSAATINIGTATVASFIGGGGLGDLIFMGLKLYRPDIILTGAILTAIMAIAIDYLLQMLENIILPGGLK